MMNFNPIPATNKFGRPLQAWNIREVERLRAKLSDPSEACERDGVYYWVSGNIIPPDVLEDAYVTVPESHRAGYEAHLEAFAREYRRRQPKEPSAEERFEARAAFGPGVVVVDVLSGRKFTT
jgi:hypothetical protein